MEDTTLQNLYIEFLPHYKMTHLIPGAAKCYHKFVLVYAMKTNAGRRHIAPLILNLGTRWRWLFNFTHWPLCLQCKKHPVPIQ
jgi:hypothetical protein